MNKNGEGSNGQEGMQKSLDADGWLQHFEPEPFDEAEWLEDVESRSRNVHGSPEEMTMFVKWYLLSLAHQFRLTGCHTTTESIRDNGTVHEVCLYRQGIPVLQGLVSLSNACESMRNDVVQKIRIQNGKFEKKYGFGFGTSATGQLSIEFLLVKGNTEVSRVISRALDYKSDHEDTADIFYNAIQRKS